MLPAPHRLRSAIFAERNPLASAVSTILPDSRIEGARINRMADVQITLAHAQGVLVGTASVAESAENARSGTPP